MDKINGTAKYLLLASACILSVKLTQASVCSPGSLITIQNPYTSRPDYVCVSTSGSSLPAGSTTYIQNTGTPSDTQNVSVSSLTVTGAQISLNGVGYIWPSAPGTSGYCLQTDGGLPTTLSWAPCGSSPPPITASSILTETTGIINTEDGAFMLTEK